MSAPGKLVRSSRWKTGKPVLDMSLAAQIVRTAERCRTPGGFDPPPPPKGSLAEQIIRAGKRRRGELP